MKKLVLSLILISVLLSSMAQVDAEIEIIEMTMPTCHDSEDGYCKATVHDSDPNPKWTIVTPNASYIIYKDTVEFNFGDGSDHKVWIDIEETGNSAVNVQYNISNNSPVFDLGNEAYIQSGDSVVLSTGLLPTSDYNFDWFFNEVYVNSDPTGIFKESGTIKCYVTDLNDCTVLDYFSLTVFPPVVNSIMETKDDKNLTYPNPATSMIYFTKNDNQIVVIRDSNGKIVKETVENSVNVENLAKGTYHLLIGDSHYEKVIIK